LNVRSNTRTSRMPASRMIRNSSRTRPAGKRRTPRPALVQKRQAPPQPREVSIWMNGFRNPAQTRA